MLFSFLDDKYAKKMRVESDGFVGRYNETYVNVYYDITELTMDLPSFIKKVEVRVMDCVMLEEDGSVDINEQKWIKKSIEKIEDNAESIAKGNISVDGSEIILYLEGGYTICGWNSEWGGISIKKDSNNDKSLAL